METDWWKASKERMAVTAESSRAEKVLTKRAGGRLRGRKREAGKGSLKKQLGNKTKKKGTRAQATVKRRANGRRGDSASG